MRTENEIRNQIKIGETKAEQMEYWDGEPDLEFHNGYIRALEWVIGWASSRYNKEDI